MAWAAGDLYNGSAVLKTECSGSSEYSATYPATKAFDAITAVDVSNCWMSSDANTPEVDGSCYLEWDFTQRMFIAGVQLQRRDSTAGQLTNYPKDIVIKAKKDEDTGWTTVKTVSLASPADGAWGDEVPFDPIYAGHYDSLRIEFHSAHYRGVVGWNVCVKEVRFRGRAAAGALTTYFEADTKGTKVLEYNGGDTDWGYVGASVAGEMFAFQFRGHDSRSDQYDANWFWATPGSGVYSSTPAPAFRCETASYHSKGTSYYIAVFNKADINGLYCNVKLYMSLNYNDNYIRVYDGAVDYQSSVQFPANLAFVPPAGAGLLQTILSQTSNGTVSASVPINTSGATGDYVTVMVTLDKNLDTGNCYNDLYAWNFSNLPIMQSAKGAVSLPLRPALGSAVDFSGDVSLPTFGITAVCEGGVALATLPCPRPEQVTNLGDITAGFSLVATGYRPLLGEAELPAPVAAGVMGGTQLAELPTGSITGICIVGFVAVGNEELPVPWVSGFTGGDGRAMLPIDPTTGAGYVGSLVSGLCVLPVPEAAGVGSAAQMFSGEAWLPLLGMTGEWQAYSWFRGNAVISFSLGAVGKAGVTAHGEAAIDFSLVAEGDVSCLGVMETTLPVPMPLGQVQEVAETRTSLLRFHRGF